jgi:hypothetical protein
LGCSTFCFGTIGTSSPMAGGFRYLTAGAPRS